MSAEAEQARCARATLYRLLARVYARELDRDAIRILVSGGVGMLLAEAAPDEPLPAADLAALQMARGLGEAGLARAYTTSSSWAARARSRPTSLVSSNPPAGCRRRRWSR